MKALIRMLYNTKSSTWHPIYYLMSFLPGGPLAEINLKVTRFKSKGHHTTGFADRAAALASADELEKSLTGQGYQVAKELETDDPWDGEDIPAETLLREA